MGRQARPRRTVTLRNAYFLNKPVVRQISGHIIRRLISNRRRVLPSRRSTTAKTTTLCQIRRERQNGTTNKKEKIEKKGGRKRRQNGNIQVKRGDETKGKVGNEMSEMTLNYNNGWPTQATLLHTGTSAATINYNRHPYISPRRRKSTAEQYHPFFLFPYPLHCISPSPPPPPRTI